MKLFSPEEIDELRQHSAVLKVNEYFLHLTPEFKEWFYEEFRKGKPAKTILMEAGFNIDIIKTRIRYPQHPSPCFEVESRAVEYRSG